MGGEGREGGVMKCVCVCAHEQVTKTKTKKGGNAVYSDRLSKPRRRAVCQPPVPLSPV